MKQKGPETARPDETLMPSASGSLASPPPPSEQAAARPGDLARLDDLELRVGAQGRDVDGVVHRKAPLEEDVLGFLAEAPG